MNNKTLRQSLVIFLCYALAYTPLLRADQQRPVSDLIAPEISQDSYQETLSPGENHDIIVTVTDNVRVDEVILNYRVIYTKTYKSVPMQNIAGTDNYKVSISAEQIKSPGIEYYVQAKDTAGNSLLHGYSFSPISAKIADDAAVATGALAATDANTPEEEESSNTWLWIGLGVLAAGAAAAIIKKPGPEPTEQTGTVSVTW